LIALFEKYKSNISSQPSIKSKGRSNNDDINKFYFDLSKKLNIPELHLDAVVWVNYDYLIDFN